MSRMSPPRSAILAATRATMPFWLPPGVVGTARWRVGERCPLGEGGDLGVADHPRHGGAESSRSAMAVGAGLGAGARAALGGQLLPDRHVVAMDEGGALLGREDRAQQHLLGAGRGL